MYQGFANPWKSKETEFVNLKKNKTYYTDETWWHYLVLPLMTFLKIFFGPGGWSPGKLTILASGMASSQQPYSTYHIFSNFSYSDRFTTYKEDH